MYVESHFLKNGKDAQVRQFWILLKPECHLLEVPVLRPQMERRLMLTAGPFGVLP